MYADFLPVLQEFAEPELVMWLFIGIAVGTIFGLIPGLGSAQTLALLIPLSLAMDPYPAIVLLLAAGTAVSQAGSVTSILLGTPGTAQNAATVFDGFPMAQRGEAGVALGAAAAAGVFGTVIGLAIMVGILPFGRALVLAFSYPEYFMIAILGLTGIAVVSERGAVLKGVSVALLGVCLTTVGASVVTGEVRYTFGSLYLWDGLPLVPVLLGLFAIGQAIQLFGAGGAIAKPGSLSQRTNRGIARGINAVFRHFGLSARCAILGTGIGIIPGVGGAVSNFVAYGYAVQSSKNPENFGKGDVRGVVAVDSANNGKDVGALVPTLVFGIPGSVEMAVLLGAFTVHGLQPGPRLMLDAPDFVLILIIAGAFSNLIASIVCLGIGGLVAPLTRISTRIIGPVIIALAVVGTYLAEGIFGHVVVAFIFGIIGYAMIRYEFSRVPLVLAMVLTGLMERSLHQTLQVMGPSVFFTRWLSLVMLIATIGVLVLPAIRRRRNQPFTTTGAGASSSEREEGGISAER